MAGTAVSAQEASAPPVIASQPVPVSTNAPETAVPVTATKPVKLRRVRTPGDPWEGFNRAMFGLHQDFDRVLFRPAALGYRALFPKPLRSGLRNGLSNLTEPFVFLNDLLQIRPGRALKTLLRFVINSSIGIGGIFDIAKKRNLPHRNNSLGNTIAHYGGGPGPYLFLPLVGPTTLRDFIADQSEDFIPPFAIGRPLYPFYRIEFQIPRLALGGIDLRAESDDALRTILNTAADPYATLRSVYLQNRAAEIAENEGKPVSPGIDDALVDPEAAAAPLPTDTATASPTDPAPSTPPIADAAPPAVPPATDVAPEPPLPEASNDATADLLCFS